ncbi:MAG: hypothetical protein K2X29_07490 [Candidatus Obscuribacterales bacterium]|nr:hypothetical protein [Candidatus Obscuribacterales bacterium]
MKRQPEEAKVRAKLLRVLSRRIEGISIEYRQAELNKLVGKTSIRAPYLKALLVTMREEQLIDCHWRQWESKDKIGGAYWSLWDHPENIRARIWCEENRKKMEEINRYHEQEKIKWEIENAPRLAKERFLKRLEDFFVQNEETVFEVIKYIFEDYKHKIECRQ